MRLDGEKVFFSRGNHLRRSYFYKRKGHKFDLVGHLPGINVNDYPNIARLHAVIGKRERLAFLGTSSAWASPDKKGVIRAVASFTLSTPALTWESHSGWSGCDGGSTRAVASRDPN